MRKPVVCVLSEIPKVADVIRQSCSTVVSKVTSVEPDNITEKDVKLLDEAEVIVSEPHFARHWLYGRPNLKLVHGTWAGIDSIMKLISAGGETPSFKYCKFGGVFGQPMAEYVVGQIVAHERNFRLAYHEQQSATWSSELRDFMFNESRPLNSLSIGILGFGEIAKKVAEVCKAFGMKIWTLVTTVPSDENKCLYVDEYRPAEGIDELLSNCHYVCNILPSTQLTRGLLDNEKLKACSPKRSVFINVGRGDICAEDSILQALREKWIRAAILDVFSTEPLPVDSLLWKHPQVTITPHVAAVTMPHQVAEVIAENLHNYANDRPLNYLIDWNKGY